MGWPDGNRPWEGLLHWELTKPFANSNSCTNSILYIVIYSKPTQCFQKCFLWRVIVTKKLKKESPLLNGKHSLEYIPGYTMYGLCNPAY